MGQIGGGGGAATGENFSKAHLLRRLSTLRPFGGGLLCLCRPDAAVVEREVIGTPINRRGGRADVTTMRGACNSCARALQRRRAREWND